MSKKFDIHEWQAKAKLAEQTMTNFGPVRSVTKYNGLPIRDNVMDYANEILNQINDYENNVGPGEQMINYNATREAVRALMNAVDRDEEGMMREKDDSAMKKSALGMAMYGKKAKMKESNLREMIRETIFEAITEELCAKGKAYIAKRKRAGEKSSAYLSGRAVKVCKGQMKG